MMAPAFNPSTWEAEVGGVSWIQGHAGLESELQGRQGYTEKPCVEEKKKMK